MSLKLFNLDSDPEERNNLAKEMPQKVEQLRKDFEQWIIKNSEKY